ncbi:MAG: hypothetical protein EOL98_07950 [Negativicutes bacterium]|nr:hypothetical protein [Negativicutes bacterium]
MENNMQNVFSKKINYTSLNEHNELTLRLFTASIALKDHPLIRAKIKTRVKYFAVLEYFTNQCSSGCIIIQARLEEYRKSILKNAHNIAVTDDNKSKIIKSIVNVPQKPWMKKYRSLLLCDLAQILIDEDKIKKSFYMIKKYLSKKQISILEFMNNCLFVEEEYHPRKTIDQRGIHQYRNNRQFWGKNEKKIIVTANMSAGKSTLINALVGKIISCMKTEACTAAIHYIYDKPVEDGISSKIDGVYLINADENNLLNYNASNETKKILVATHFSTFISKSKYRFCLIDSPGVNSSINREHATLARKALVEEKYDHLIYVFNANQLGTYDELQHLKYIATNIPKEKVIFVLNKIDDFYKKDDSIDESIKSLKNDLTSIGYNNPTINPISAYFALLVKMKLIGKELSEDEQDSFDTFVRKFNKPYYNLSRFYPHASREIKSVYGDLEDFAIKCGLYGLEYTLYGDMEQK